MHNLKSHAGECLCYAMQMHELLNMKHIAGRASYACSYYGQGMPIVIISFENEANFAQP